jgi:nucleotide-binding universal stress UspA family protein
MRIAVCTDFSEGSRQAFAAAAELARRFQGELLLVSQAELPVPYGAWSSPGASELYFAVDLVEACRELEKRLADLARSEASFAGIEVKTHLVRESGFEAFVESLRREAADLLVLSTHGRRGFQRLLLGSFAERAVRLSPCPVLVCRVSPEGGAPAAFAPRRLFVPCDLSSASGPVLDAASKWARVFGAVVRLFHAIDLPPGGVQAAGEAIYGWEEYLKWMREKSTLALQEHLKARFAGITGDTTVAEGHPVLEILAEARRWNADLIVMGSHGFTGLRHFVIGSVAERTVRQAPCPVLVVREREAQA